VTVPEFLSEEWFEAFAAALASLPVTSGAGDGSEGLCLGQVVTAVPEKARAAGVHDGEVRYTIVLGRNGSASLLVGSTESAEVTLLEDWSTAEAIASGSASLPDLLGAGRVKLRGDPRALVAAGDLLARLAPLISAALSGGQAS